MTASVTDDIAAGLAARHEGQAAVQAADVAVNRQHGDYIRTALDILGALGDPFTTDDVRDMAQTLADEDGHHFDPHPNLWGSIIGNAATSGLIVRVGEANSARPTRNASRNAIWTAAPTSPAPPTASGPASRPSPG